MPTTVRIVPVRDSGVNAKDEAAKRYLATQERTQDFCLLFDTPDANLDEFVENLDKEYGLNSQGYAQTVIGESKFHQVKDPTFFSSKKETLGQYSGSGHLQVKTPVSYFHVDEQGNFTFSTTKHIGGLFFTAALKIHIQAAFHKFNSDNASQYQLEGATVSQLGHQS